MPPNTEAVPDRKRVTVDYSLKDYKLIEREAIRQTRERGYTVTISDVARQLVRKLGASNA